MWSRNLTGGSGHSASTRRRISETNREHARRIGMPGDQIFPVVNTVVKGPDKPLENPAR